MGLSKRFLPKEKDSFLWKYILSLKCFVKSLKRFKTIVIRGGWLTFPANLSRKTFSIKEVSGYKSPQGVFVYE